METFAEALNKNINMHPALTLEEIQSKLDNLNRLFSVFEGPEYRELIRFAVEWEKLGRELKALKFTINEHLVKKEINPINEFLKKLKKN
jgi:SMC interacting uncharacterized protein involved in chromosome segregation